MKTKWKKIGVIGVDSGLVYVGDPGYVLHQVHNSKSTFEMMREPEPKPKDIGMDWTDFVNNLYKKESFEKEGYAQYNYDAGHPGLGVCVGSRYGDGTFNVMGRFKEGRLVEIKINFEGGENECVSKEKRRFNY